MYSKEYDTEADLILTETTKVFARPQNTSLIPPEYPPQLRKKCSSAITKIIRSHIPTNFKDRLVCDHYNIHG